MPNCVACLEAAVLWFPGRTTYTKDKQAIVHPPVVSCATILGRNSSKCALCQVNQHSCEPLPSTYVACLRRLIDLQKEKTWGYDETSRLEYEEDEEVIEARAAGQVALVEIKQGSRSSQARLAELKAAMEVERETADREAAARLLALEQHKVAIDMANSLRVLAEIQLRRLPAKTSREGLELPDRVHSGEVHSGLLPPEIDPPEDEDNVVFLTAKKARARLRSETDAPATPPVKR
ncbi:hypothetical protein H9Q73_008215, partial [Fusarium xylarioides]